MRIAVIGGGVSGLVAAYLLSRVHEVVVFEAGRHIGGHTNTIEVRENGTVLPVDTGFMVFNDRTYPNFVRLLDQLGVESQPSCMSFSLQCERTGLEYNSLSLNRLFVQRRNFLKPSFHRMWIDILRFNREAREILTEGQQITVGEWLDRNSYSRGFRDQYLKAIAASIWSSRPAQIDQFPISFLLQFLDNHGLLSVQDQPQWQVIKGGSRRYVERLIKPFRDSIRLTSPVVNVRRTPETVEVKARGSEPESFDHVVLALHSDQALAVLDRPTRQEREILGAIGYQANETLLHSDKALMPFSRRAWASWNYHLPAQTQPRVAITYHSNRLLSLNAQRDYFVTLNRSHGIAEDQIHEEMTYEHPVYSVEAVTAQKRHDEISGVNRTHYCGAYWGYGFHEDGVNSALRVCREFGQNL